MRPVKLTVSAFGSYLKRTEIDFARLGTNGIYLITGDTGSGKTTIFDALSYALFGSGSGELRTGGRMFRSKYAGLDDETFVELEFMYKEKPYKIRRNPEYERYAKRGGGVTVEKASELLVLPSGKNITGHLQVNNEIKELLGIDSKQFSQIVMLPQGNFMKFLMADTTEKGKIFSDIFKTHLYAELQEKVRADSRECENKIESIRGILSRSVMDIICPETSKAYEYISRLKEDQENSSYYSCELILENLNIIDAEQRKQRSDYKKQIDKVNGEIENINKDLGIHKVNENLRKNIESNKKLIEEGRARIPQLSAKLEQAEAAAKLCPELDIKCDQIKKQFPRYQEKDELTEQYSAAEKKLKTAGDKACKLREELESGREKITCINNKISKLSGDDADEIPLSEKLSSMKNKSDIISEMFSLTDQYNEESKRLEVEQKKLGLFIQKYEQCRDDYIKKEKLYDSAIAGILAEKLTDGESCPVCGSKEHPHIASKPENTPTEQQLEECREKLDEAENGKNRFREKVNSIISRINNISDNILKQNKKLAFDELAECDSIEIISQKISGIREKVTAEISETEEKLKKIREKKIRRKKLQSEAEVLRDKNSGLEKSLKQLEDELSLCRENTAVLKTKIEAIQLDYESLEQAKGEYSSLQRKRAALQRDYETAKEEFDRCMKRISQAETAVKTSAEQIDKSDIPELTVLEKRLEQCKKERNTLSAGLSNTDHIIETNNDKGKKIKSLDSDIEKMYEKYRWMKELSDLLSGRITKSDADKITLETRVQMVYFERILGKANVHLLKITGGQYELVRAGESSDGRRKTGLDLNIFDHYNDSQRDVKTLSGGESFKASLALALGMADEVQSCSGGIQMDTMFIDEGFGSLDDESLNQAVNTLNTLARSNRLIGIISHVSELKWRIDKKIIVTKDGARGSSVKIEC
ncbi:MAG: AAA family ATPase [Porcipelethomonas sp.]